MSKLNYLIAALFIASSPVYIAETNIKFTSSLDCFEACEKQYKNIRRYARNGSPHAQTLLALIHKTGELQTEVDPDESWRWMKRAQKQKFAPAQYHYSTWYRVGYETEIDIEKADILLEKAVAQKYPPALFDYGLLLLEKGEIDQGLDFIYLASDGKSPKAVKFLKDLEQRIASKKSLDTDNPPSVETAIVEVPTPESNPEDYELTIYGSKATPETLMVNMIKEISDLAVYDRRGISLSRGDVKCGQPGSGCKAFIHNKLAVNHNIFDF